jgi:hypothetical protein
MTQSTNLIDLNNLSPEQTQYVIQRAQELWEQDQAEKNKNRWKSPFEWTEEEIHELVMEEVGEDTLFPRGYQVLIKLWMPPRELDDGCGLIRTDHMMRNERITTNIGRVLRMGSVQNRRAKPYSVWRALLSASQRRSFHCNDN